MLAQIRILAFAQPRILSHSKRVKSPLHLAPYAEAAPAAATDPAAMLQAFKDQDGDLVLAPLQDVPQSPSAIPIAGSPPIAPIAGVPALPIQDASATSPQGTVAPDPIEGPGGCAFIAAPVAAGGVQSTAAASSDCGAILPSLEYAMSGE